MNVLITGAWDGANLLDKKLEELGLECLYSQHEDQKLPCSETWPDIVICANLFLHHDIKKFSNLKFIQAASTGIEKFPLDYLQKNKIDLKNSRGAYSVPVSEFVVMSILDLCKQAKFFFHNQENRIWKKNRSLLELSGQNVCIVGCGSIGTQVAKKLKAFDCKILGVRKTIKPNKYFDETFTTEDLPEVLKKSQIIILTLPLSSDTFHLFDKKMFEYVNNDSIFVNVSRGEIVDLDALLINIDRFHGVVLDVFEKEPLDQNSSLWDKQNVFIYPHNSFVSNKNKDRLQEIIINNLKDLNFV